MIRFLLCYKTLLFNSVGATIIILCKILVLISEGVAGSPCFKFYVFLMQCTPLYET